MVAAASAVRIHLRRYYSFSSSSFETGSDSLNPNAIRVSIQQYTSSADAADVIGLVHQSRSRTDSELQQNRSQAEPTTNWLRDSYQTKGLLAKSYSIEIEDNSNRENLH